ncbi:eIF-2-alpha kinase activator GCN1 [Orobanche minor]
MSKKADTIVKMSSLVLPLVQLVKTGLLKLHNDEIVSKEKVWSWISQNEPSLVPISLVSKLPVEDCMACVELVEVLLVDYSLRVLVAVPAKSITQLILFFICHPSWDIRRFAYDLTKRVLAAVPELSKALLLEFSNYLSVVAEKLITVKTRRLQKCLQKLGFDIVDLIMTELLNVCKALYFHLKNLPTRLQHDEISEKDIQIFRTPEGTLLTEQGVYIAVKVLVLQKNLSLMLRALGEMAMANPVFAHTELPTLVKFVNPLLRSPIVDDVAYQTMVMLSKCTAAPLCNWALDIATALRLIANEEVVLPDLPSLGDSEWNGRPSLGLFERVINELKVSCRNGPLPVDSFTFILPYSGENIVIVKEYSSSRRCSLDTFLAYVSHIAPTSASNAISNVLYHVLGVVPASQGSVGPALNELYLGLQPHEVAHALSGFVAQLAEDIWDRYGHEFGTDCSGLFKALSHVNYNVRVAAAEALAAALDGKPESIQESLSTLFSLYIRDAGLGGDNIDAGWLGRQGITLALQSSADVLRTKDLPVVVTFLISRALADANADVRGRMINVGIVVIDKHGKNNVYLLIPIFENYLNKVSPGLRLRKVRSCAGRCGYFHRSFCKTFGRDDAKVQAVVEKLFYLLNTPSEDVQRAVSSCLSPLMKSKQLMKSEKYGQRRGAAFGLSGVVKGLGIRSLENCGIASVIREGPADRNSAKSREGALLAFECLCEKLGRLFEPYVIQMLPLLLVGLSDPVMAVRDAAECAARAMMSHLSAQGVKLVLPSLLKGLEDKAWRTKQSSWQLLGAMAYCAPQLLSHCLPKIVPKLIEQVGNVIKNPDIDSLVPTLLIGLTDPNDHTSYSVDILLQAKPSAISAHTSTFGPVLTECLDGIPPVKLAAERCTENVQAAHRTVRSSFTSIAVKGAPRARLKAILKIIAPGSERRALSVRRTPRCALCALSSAPRARLLFKRRDRIKQSEKGAGGSVRMCRVPTEAVVIYTYCRCTTGILIIDVYAFGRSYESVGHVEYCLEGLSPFWEIIPEEEENNYI